MAWGTHLRRSEKASLGTELGACRDLLLRDTVVPTKHGNGWHLMRLGTVRVPAVLLGWRGRSEYGGGRMWRVIKNISWG